MASRRKREFEEGEDQVAFSMERMHERRDREGDSEGCSCYRDKEPPRTHSGRTLKVRFKFGS